MERSTKKITSTMGVGGPNDNSGWCTVDGSPMKPYIRPFYSTIILEWKRLLSLARRSCPNATGYIIRLDLGSGYFVYVKVNELNTLLSVGDAVKYSMATEVDEEAAGIVINGSLRRN
ncbi:hypothetical protein L1887_27545 [Cichorium endivia]|nr:hypothetical protein L1887_27545 [Cichorium endivia]